MTFTINDLSDLKQQLVEHPEWHVELRDLFLSEDFRALPAILREVAATQRALAESQRCSEQRLARLEEIVSQLAEAQRQLAETEERIARRGGRADKELSQLAAGLLEERYHRRAANYFGRWLRRIAVVDANELVDRCDEHLSPDELGEVLLTELIVRGRSADKPDGPEVWLAVTISDVVRQRDVARALRCAELLRRAGLPALPVAAGHGVTRRASAAADKQGVAICLDGGGLFWSNAFSYADRRTRPGGQS